MIEAIKYNLANLTNFSGRDSRSTFWWYVLFLVVAQYLVSLVATIPLMAGVMGSAIDAAQAGADPDRMEARVFAQMAGAMKDVMWVSVVIGVITALMLVASFVRRLHDSGKSGLWAIVPLVTQAVAMVLSVRMMDRIEELFTVASDPAQLQQLQYQMMVENGGFVAYIGYLVVIIFGVLKSDDGPNKYGEGPVRFS